MGVKLNSKQKYFIFAIIIIVIIVVYRHNTEQFANPRPRPRSINTIMAQQSQQSQELIKLEIEKANLQSMISELTFLNTNNLNIRNNFRIGDNILFSPTEMHITTTNRGEINMLDTNSSITIGDQTLDYDKIKYINNLYNKSRLI